MKLAKRMLACVVVLVLMSSFALTAFAAGGLKVNITADKASAKVGDTVIVAVKFDNAKGFKAINLFMDFNPDVLEFVSARNATVKADDKSEQLESVAGELVLGKNNQVSLAATSTESIQDTDSTPVIFYTFKVKAVGDAGFKVTVTSIQGEGMTLENTTAVAPSFKGVTAETTTAKVTTTKKDDTATTTTKVTTTKKTTDEVPTKDLGDAGLAVAAGLVVLAGAAFVVSKKKK